MMFDLSPTICAICRVEGNADELYPANLNQQAFDPAVFSARRLPDRLHYRLVRCRSCGLVRSDPVANRVWLAGLYRQSTFDYGAEIDNLKRAYGRYLRRLERLGVVKGALLEIGCGNGFFLEEALAQGYLSVSGVEPSQDAVQRAAPAIKPFIQPGIIEASLFAPGSFDVICMFQLIDHLPDPAAVIDACFHLLKKGGMVLTINHNVAALSARLLKEKSPIVDVEHTYLFSPATLRRIFEQNGYRVRDQGQVTNDYSIHYLVRLLPLPAGFKARFLDTLRKARPGRLSLRIPLGNLYLVAQRSV